MSIHRKPITVDFFVVEPSMDHSKTFTGEFPHKRVLDAIDELDMERGEYHIRHNLYGDETFCLVHDGPIRLLGAYNKDMSTLVLTERKGELRALLLDKDEGIVDASYVAFFDRNVVALLRTSNRSPGFMRIANWLSVCGPYQCHLAPIQRKNVWTDFDEMPDKIRAIYFGAKPRRIANLKRLIRPNSAALNVAEALDSAARVQPVSDSEVGIRIRAPKTSLKGEWWRDMRPAVVELEEALPVFERAQIESTDGRKVDLRASELAVGVEVEIDSSRRVSRLEAARALAHSYEIMQGPIERALESRKR